MKKFLMFLGAAIFVFGISSCKKVNVPEKVKTAFGQKFQNVTNVDWEQEENNTYEAEFKMKEIETSAVFDNNGTWLRTETEIKLEAVPEVVQKSMQAKFSDYSVKEAEYFESPTQSGYEIELKLKNGEKIKASFDKEGHGLKREKVTDKD